MNLSNESKKKFLKYGIGLGILFMVIFSLTAHFSLSEKYSLFSTKKEEEKTLPSTSNEILIGEDVPQLIIDETLNTLSEKEEEKLKKELLELVSTKEIDEAYHLIQEKQEKYVFSEDSQLYDWYIDLNSLANRFSVPKEEQLSLYTSLNVPELMVLMIPRIPQILLVSELLKDLESLVPYAVQYPIILNQRVYETADEWTPVSDKTAYYKETGSLGRVMEFDVELNGEVLTAVVAYQNFLQKNVLLGFYPNSSETNFLTSQVVEDARESVANIAIFQ